MVNLGALNQFDSFIKKLEKSIGLCQPCDLHPCISHTFYTPPFICGLKVVPVAYFINHHQDKY